MKSPIAALAPITMGCATTPAEEAPRPASSGPCNAAGLGGLIGRPADRALVEAALTRSGARRMRRIRPGDVVTMDYSRDRLNVHVDAEGKAVRFACG